MEDLLDPHNVQNKDVRLGIKGRQGKLRRVADKWQDTNRRNERNNDEFADRQENCEIRVCWGEGGERRSDEGSVSVQQWAILFHLCRRGEEGGWKVEWWKNVFELYSLFCIVEVRMAKDGADCVRMFIRVPEWPTIFFVLQRGPVFKFVTGDRLFWCRYFVVYLDNITKQSTTALTIRHPTVRRRTFWATRSLLSHCNMVIEWVTPSFPWLPNTTNWFVREVTRPVSHEVTSR